ncbi:aspartate kinase [Algibacter lectus]|uniref:Aspartokinase n=1 Tax=Algibacter lectus TaxID=221126 RepID=A0A090X5L7_9FLAO|nr:aspartate kinase [Algibacter lectus]MWW24618.1 aspartate kinase [Algibacter lectus]TDY62638.1 aspartate kinase [Algibacter lectus]GAL79752.1 aspartokinase [Algibacter lectus]SFC95423.1 aspartate kinase [Algibacter lectus]
MKVLKFGGTSVGSVENMLNVKSIINDGAKKVVVLSAMSGTTNQLVAIASDIENNTANEAVDKINKLHETYFEVIDTLLQNESLNAETKAYVSEVFNFLVECTYKKSSELLNNQIVAQGELMSTFMFNSFLKQEGVSSVLLPALDFMKIDSFKEPDINYIKEHLEVVLNNAGPADIYITQGFICLDDSGAISNLQRGGSDYTATIIGAAIKAEEVQIWTDIDGMHNNDPRYVENTHPISDLSFDEAAELAYFGAKILHPQTVTPVRADSIPVRLKNTMNPEAHGTLISSKTSETGIKAIAAKDNITAIKIKSARMLQAHGFLKKVFEIFETYQTSIDMITTSEVAVSLTIDDDKNLDKILVELDKIASIEVDKNQSIVCLVGHTVVNHQDTFKLFQILQDVKIRMISYGGSNNNISLLIDSSDKINTLQKLNNYLFELVTL